MTLIVPLYLQFAWRPQVLKWPSVKVSGLYNTGSCAMQSVCLVNYHPRCCYWLCCQIEIAIISIPRWFLLKTFEIAFLWLRKGTQKYVSIWHFMHFISHRSPYIYQWKLLVLALGEQTAVYTERLAKIGPISFSKRRIHLHL